MAGIRHRTKKLPEYLVNGWIIKKRPNSFSEKYAYEATVWNSDGYLLALHGFFSLNTARAFCRKTPPPTVEETP
jgi:hypothetical protein